MPLVLVGVLLPDICETSTGEPLGDWLIITIATIDSDSILSSILERSAPARV